MAEAFGVAASALTVVELLAAVIKMCTKYLKDVSNARDDIIRLQREATSLGYIAESVQRLLKVPQESRLATTEKLDLALKEGRIELEQLQLQLSPGKGKTVMRRFGLGALKWPFSSKDLEKRVQDLSRYTQTISTALQVDQT
jgi:hypothetical protein